MLEHAGATPMEMASVAFPDGHKMILGLNVQSTGQSHATVFGRLLAHKLGIDAGQIEHHHGDTDMGLTGGASVGSRSAMCAGNAIVHTADVMLAKGSAALPPQTAPTLSALVAGGYDVSTSLTFAAPSSASASAMLPSPIQLTSRSTMRLVRSAAREPTTT